MSERTSNVLIVEDDYFIATDLADGFQKAGIRIIGPVPSLAKALAILEQEQIGGAVLDINLDGEKVYEVADALIERGVPIVFMTGYERPSIPARYDDVPLCLKPVASEQVIDALALLWQIVFEGSVTVRAVHRRRPGEVGEDGLPDCR